MTPNQPSNTHDDTRRSATRRSILKSGAGLTALAALGGTASAHDFSGDTSDQSSSEGHDHTDASSHGKTGNAELLDYHSLGAVGPSSESGAPENPHYGGITELRTSGDYAYVGCFSSDNPTGDRGMAVLDVSEFNAAEKPKELRDAELSVLSFLRNDDPAAAVMDVKVSDDGEYVFLSKQPYTALFDETDPKPDTGGEGASASASALQAVDVSDPENPRVVGTYDAFTTGPHNATYHEIGGSEYVFAVKDLNDGTSGLYVFRFERTTGALVLVNRWTTDGDFGVGDGGLAYVHDITVQDDPRLGRPVGYLSYWDQGLFALDLSDPTAIEVLGHYSMGAAHYAEPAPTYIDGKRVVVAGQEISSQQNGSSGKVYLLDADGLDEGYDGSDNIARLDEWEWLSTTSFENFTLSPHNFDVTADGRVHLGHYHGGTRFLTIDASSGSLTEEGSFQSAKDVPEASKMEGLNHAAPFTWSAVEHEGVTYVSDVNTGVYALRYKPGGRKNRAIETGTGTGAGLATAGVAGAALRYRDCLGGTFDRLRGD